MNALVSNKTAKLPASSLRASHCRYLTMTMVVWFLPCIRHGGPKHLEIGA